MTYNEALEYIHSVCWMGSRPGLERITELCGLLGNPEDSLKFIRSLEPHRFQTLFYCNAVVSKRIFYLNLYVFGVCRYGKKRIHT